MTALLLSQFNFPSSSEAMSALSKLIEFIVLPLDQGRLVLKSAYKEPPKVPRPRNLHFAGGDQGRFDEAVGSTSDVKVQLVIQDVVMQ